MSFRLVVAIDIEAESLQEAYGKLHKTLTATKLAWESSDEAYDQNGEEIDEEDLHKARSAFYEEEFKETC